MVEMRTNTVISTNSAIELIHTHEWITLYTITKSESKSPKTPINITNPLCRRLPDSVRKTVNIMMKRL